MQRPDWNSSNRDIKDDSVLGTVVKVEANGTRVNVKWDNKLTNGAVEDSMQKPPLNAKRSLLPEFSDKSHEHAQKITVWQN